jgi:hypothetical protein
VTIDGETWGSSVEEFIGETSPTLSVPWPNITLGGVGVDGQCYTLSLLWRPGYWACSTAGTPNVR